MRASGPSLGLVTAALVLGLAGTAIASPGPDWSQTEAEPVLTDLGRPVDLALGPEGQIWWNAFDEGNVTVYDPDDGSREVVFHVDPLENPAERGLVGLALDPDHADNDVFYVYYTTPDPDDPEGGTNHLSRVEGGEETRLLEVPANVWHNGGRIEFDDEGRMFVSTGDNKRGSPAQDPSSRLGAILHLHPNGTPARGNIEGYVHALGFRNVYGLAYDEADDRLWATENGHYERDEINVIERGANYGWPRCEGNHRYRYEQREPTDEPCPASYRDPVRVFHDNYTIAPTGATVFDGDLYWGDIAYGAIHRLTRANETGGWNHSIVHRADDEVYDVEAHEGDLYYAARGEIVRLDLPDSGEGETPPEGAEGSTITEIPGPSAGLAALATLAALAARRRR